MAVPTTNVSLGSIQTEFGGSAPISINEYYRGGTYVPIGTTSSYGTIPTSGQIDFGVFRGTSKGLDSQVVTVGYASDPTFYSYGSEPGYYGSISDGTSNIYSGASILALNYFYYYGNELVPTFDSVIFIVSGNSPNSGWSTMSINGINFSRSGATYYYDSGQNKTSWYWNTPGLNPFGTTIGATKTVIWT